VIRSESRREIAAKTLLTRAPVRALILYTLMPQIRLTPEAARDYIVSTTKAIFRWRRAWC
jgi:hypothetical protein